MNSDLCCVLAPYYRCEACEAVQCEKCIDKKGSLFEQTHPNQGTISYICMEKDKLVSIPRVIYNG